MLSLYSRYVSCARLLIHSCLMLGCLQVSTYKVVTVNASRHGSDPCMPFPSSRDRVTSPRDTIDEELHAPNEDFREELQTWMLLEVGCGCCLFCLRERFSTVASGVCCVVSIKSFTLLCIIRKSRRRSQIITVKFVFGKIANVISACTAGLNCALCNHMLAPGLMNTNNCPECCVRQSSHNSCVVPQNHGCL